jgi:histidine triad (HIT) family protein
MYNHAPLDYVCPICLAIQGVESDATMAKQADIIYRDELSLAYVNSKFITTNPGHVIVVPTAHFENLYELPIEYMTAIMQTAQKVALAFKMVRKAEGVWIGQNNEPASGQHAMHYHMHVVPRFAGDNMMKGLAEGGTYVANPLDRIPYAEALRAHFKNAYES